MRPLLNMLVLSICLNPSILFAAETEGMGQQTEQQIARDDTGAVLASSEVLYSSSLVRRIADNYKVPPDVAARIVAFAQDNSDPVFPKIEDILAVIAVESRFQSHVENHGSVGLMGIRYRSHKLTKAQVLDIKINIAYGARYLKDLYLSLGSSTKAAFQAYNVGPWGYTKKGARSPGYLSLVAKHRNRISPTLAKT